MRTTTIASRTLVAVVLAAGLVASAIGFGVGYAVGTSQITQSNAANERGGDLISEGDTADGVAENSSTRSITVFTTSERKVDGERANFIAAVRENGSRIYYNDSLRVYNDVDPVPGTNATVEYVGANRLTPAECNAETACWLNVVERVNLTTGETRRVYSRKTSVRHGQWHDVDRIDDSHLLVADIALDRAFVVDLSSGIHEWTWSAQEDLPLSSGGPFPRDWTHINDVELLPDGRVMVSLRNQDRVGFVDHETGLLENWTLGEEDDYDVLYEQHNPDYIPVERGGPAVIVSDSENDRIVEYRRTEDGGERTTGSRASSDLSDGEWELSWSWSDDRLDWPRDADRLPNGHTLITDTDGGRVLEIDEEGSIVWSVEVEGAYDAERLGTGDESAGGPAANVSRLEGLQSPPVD